MNNQNQFGTAVVVGASIAGSCAAAVLARHFRQVIVVDRDDEPDGETRRRGAAHAHHFHSLTAGGRLDFEALFPGLTDDLIARGVPYSDPMTTKYLGKFGWHVYPEASTMRRLQATRPTLEHYVRTRAGSLNNVQFRWRRAAAGLEVCEGRVVGLHTNAVEGGESELIQADLVVDTSGRASRAPQWLSNAGFPEPEVTTIDARWGYGTVYVRVPDDWEPGFSALYIAPTVTGDGPTATRGAAMWPLEDNLVVVTAQGCAGDVPPNNYEDFLEYLGSIGSSYFRDFVETYGVVTELETWRNTSNRLRDYAGLTPRPENFILIGDAVTAFNPIYGQGMSVAARSARKLDAELDRFAAGYVSGSNLDGFAEQFQKGLSEVVDPCWAFSTAADYKVPGVKFNGEVLEVATTPASEFNDRLQALATEDPEIALKIFETAHMVRTPEWLLDEDLRKRVHDDWERLGRLRRAPTFEV